MLDIFTVDNMRFLFNGLLTTFTIALATIVISILFGTVLALARNYSKGLPLMLSTFYIEMFRNTPLLLWILAIRFLVPIPPVYSGITSFSLFTSAIMAEIIRGGLNSINKGQFEGAYSQGFTFVQTVVFIILPQCFKNIVPSMLSQIITIIKDTSFLWVVGIEEFTGKGMILMGNLGTTTQIFTLYGFMALLYFGINFALSSIVRSKQHKALENN